MPRDWPSCGTVTCGLRTFPYYHVRGGPEAISRCAVAERSADTGFGMANWLSALLDKGMSGSILQAMNTNFRKLPLDKRIRLVEYLWDSIAADQNALPLTP